MKRGWMQAKDIDATQLLDTIYRIAVRQQRWVNRWELAEAYPDVPPKVLMAKCQRLIHADKLNGCTCGCRGDFTLTGDGYAMIEDYRKALEG